MARAREAVAAARDRLQPAVQVIERFRYDPPAIGYKQTAMLFLAMCVVAWFLFYAGKRAERSWWRSEIAAKSPAVKSVMDQLGAEAPDLDERLINTWVQDHADQLRAAERRLSDAQRRAAAEIEAARKTGAPLPVDACRLPSHCLRN